MIDTINRVLEIVFVKDQKQFVQVLHKKCKSDYLLNVNKIIREKFEQDILVPNKIQSFLINYEIKKLIDKAVNVRNRKYSRIIYVNTVLNTRDFLTNAYEDVKFEPLIIDLEEEFCTELKIKTIKKGR